MLRSAPAALLLLSLFACASATPASTGDDADVVSDDENDDGAKKAGKPSAPKTVQSLANLGDSISEGFDADDAEPLQVDAALTDFSAVFSERPEFSWVQGTDPRVSSVAAHYKKLNPELVTTRLSRSGAEIVGDDSDLPNFEEQARMIATKKASPDLVYVLLGGNDVCNRPRSTSTDATATMYPVSRVREFAVKGLRALAEVLPEGATVRVVSMPRVDRLYDAVGDARVPVRYDSGVGDVSTTLTCKAFWTVTAAAGQGVCPIVTTENSAAKRAQIGKRVDEYNVALAEEVRRFANDRTLNPKRIQFVSDWSGTVDEGGTVNASGGTFDYTADHISKRDCFHPSIVGQNALADMVLRRAKFE